MTTNEYQEQPPKIIEKFSKRQLWEESVISKGYFNVNVFPRVVWILSQLTAFVLKLQQKNLSGQKSIVWKTA